MAEGGAVMGNFADYMKAVQERLNLHSLVALAEQLSIPSESVEKIIRNELTPDDELCLRIAYLTGDDPALVLALAHYDSATVITRPYWEKILLKLRDGRVHHSTLTDRRSWNERRMQSSGGSTAQKVSLSHDRRQKIDRRSWLDRRFSCISRLG
jgi:plasmid maintenance system antidote protein VapI